MGSFCETERKKSEKVNVLLFNKVLIILRLMFLTRFVRELYVTSFKTNKKKWIWFLTVLVFGAYGYSTYLVYKRRLIKKRIFNPKINNNRMLTATEN